VARTLSAPARPASLPFALAAAQVVGPALIGVAMSQSVGAMIPPGGMPPIHDASEPRWVPPLRPGSQSPTCEAQRVDLAAAIAGKITWRQYMAMWGPAG
jgi:hypothetical protein